ncbi:MAG: hypothetical protein ABFD76_14415, partial [Smithella sp.]
TEAKEKNIMAATGKLLLQTSTAAVNPLAVLVLPADKMTHYEQELQGINICVIGFQWQEEKAVFSGLEKIRFD